MDYDVAVVGAGVAGLTAAGVLARVGLRVCCLEAGDVPGGRIRTHHDPLAALPVELGAEFVHGRAPATWDIIRDANLAVFERTQTARSFVDGSLQDDRRRRAVDSIMEAATKSRRAKDESFAQFLRRSRAPAPAKKWAASFVEGFEAALQDRISIASLRLESQASKSVDGDRIFRIANGYDALVHSLIRSIPDWPAVLRLQSIVEHVAWRRGHVVVTYRHGIDDSVKQLSCRQLIITVPLGVLQAGAIAFDPEPATALMAARALEFGHVYRVTFRFRDAFWEEDQRMQKVGFVFSQEPVFPTWWTTEPVHTPILSGWTAGSPAENLRSSTQSAVIEQALASLARILRRKIPSPEAAHFHDWTSDPFFRGAYSYVPVNALKARQVLAEPVEDTLFFAGEATETTGHAAMVHGAIMTGQRSAQRILAQRA